MEGRGGGPGWGGGVIITGCSHQCKSPFPFKRALCSSFPGVPALSTSVCLSCFSEFHFSTPPNPPSFLFPSNVLVLSHMPFLAKQQFFFPFLRLWKALTCFIEARDFTAGKCGAIKGGGGGKIAKTGKKGSNDKMDYSTFLSSA